MSPGARPPAGAVERGRRLATGLEEDVLAAHVVALGRGHARPRPPDERHRDLRRRRHAKLICDKRPPEAAQVRTR